MSNTPKEFFYYPFHGKLIALVVAWIIKVVLILIIVLVTGFAVAIVISLIVFDEKLGFGIFTDSKS